jgi:hypothetical protein
MGKLFIYCKNLLDPSQSEKWTIARAFDSGLSPKSIHLVTNSMAVSFGSLDSTPLRLVRDRFLGPLGVICAIEMSAMAWWISSTWCHKLIMHLRGCWKKKNNLGTVPAGEKYEGTMAL